MKIAIPFLAIVFTLSALFYSIQNSIDQFGQSFAGYDRLSNHRNNPAALQNSLISFDSPLACQQNAFYPSDDSKQKLFQKDLCDCATQWYASKYNPDLQEVKKACQMLQESGGLDVACVESRIEVYEPFTYDSYNNACKGSYSFVFVLSDGTKQEEQWRDIGVTFDEAKFMCQMLSGNQVVDTPTPEFLNPPDPGPNPGPNPNPNPNPEPSPIDPEILSILQSILGTPVIPITGAVAGGLVAWVISMLSGGRTVLPTAPRPPTGGVRPGQVGPDGKVWSPGQGWVTKSTYDYQQKWIQKGWRLNSQTGKLEVQPGAINERGKVWYKLPHAMDEGDSHNWVDKAKVEECERNLAEGNVWDRNVGWKAPEDLKRRYSDQDAIHRRSIIDNAAKNAQIQKDVQDASQKRLQEYQDWLKQYEHKEQILQNMDAAQDEFRRQRAIDNKLALKEFLLKSAAFPVDGADAIGARMCPSIGEIYQGAYDGVKETASEIKEIYKETYQGAYDSAKEVASDLKEVYQGAYDGVKEATSDLKDLVYHDGVQEKLRKKLSGKISDWTTKFTKNAASKYTESPIKKQLFDTYGKPALQRAQGVGSTLKDKAFEAAAGDFPEKAVDLIFDQAEKHPELIR